MSGFDPPPPAWNLPEGVNASLWDYAHRPGLAEDEDEYFRDHPLFRADGLALEQRFAAPGPLIDLGCGSGRLSLRFAARGFPVVAVDLSGPMLARVGRKAADAGLAVGRLRANLCDLRSLPSGHFAYALMMFSTLGMVRGRGARRKALAEAARVLRPGGCLALHAHNLWLNLRDSQGRRWLAGQAWSALRGLGGPGDRRMTYRGVPGMEVHLYRWGELRRDLAWAGLAVAEALPIDAVTARGIAAPGWLPGVRAGGWIVFATKVRARGEEEARATPSRPGPLVNIYRVVPGPVA